MDSKKFSPDVQTGYLSDEKARSYFSRVGFGAFALGVAFCVGATLLSMLASRMLPSDLLSDKLSVAIIENLITMLSLYCLAAPIFCAVTSSLPTMRPFMSGMKFSSFLGGFAICMAAMTLGNYISNILLTWFGGIFGSIPSNPLENSISPEDPAMVIITITFIVILAPVLEEFLFRRIICSKLLALGEGYAIFLSGAIFALVHGNLYQIPYAFLVGSFLAFIYIKTGRLVYTILYHMLLNFIGTVIAPWVSATANLEETMDTAVEMLTSFNVDISPEVLTKLLIVSVYSTVIMGLSVLGIVLFFIAKKRKRLALEQGILPPPKKHRVANLFFNGGVVAAIVFFSFYLIISLG